MSLMASKGSYKLLLMVAATLCAKAHRIACFCEPFWGVFCGDVKNFLVFMVSCYQPINSLSDDV